MLKQRIITALILAGAFFASVLYAPVHVLADGFGLVVLAGSWEWARLAGIRSAMMRFAYVLVFALLLIGLALYCHITNSPAREMVQPFLGLACLLWSIALLWVKTYPGSAVIWGSVVMRGLLGYANLGLAWLAAVYLLSMSHGGYLMILLVVIVATADIGAYFAGRAWGRHKLAPEVSPAKTWEGFWGGVFGVLALAAIVWAVVPPMEVAHVGIGGLLAVFLSTALASVVGDLVESMVKRESGVKDSGGLLPGHGGVMDRLDSLVAAAPVFALGLLLVGW